MLDQTESKGRGTDFGLTGDIDYSTKPLPDGSYSLEQMYRMLYDLRLEPDWRREANLEHAYFDNDQLKQETLERMRENGIPPLVVNLIAPAINSVLGFEIISRSDVRVLPETDEDYEIALGLNQRMKIAQRLAKFNRATTDTFGDAIKGGIGWIEVSRNSDPFKYPYRVECVPWREMFWDYRSRKHDLSDARFIVRRRWYDFDVLIHHFPKHERLIRSAMSGWPGDIIAEWEDLDVGSETVNLSYAHNQEKRFTLEEDEWRQTSRGRMALYEIIYKIPSRVRAIRTHDGHTMTLDENDMRHRAMLDQGQAMIVEGVTQQLRQAFYIGPHRMADRPLPGNRCHYVPCVCHRRDSDGSVYGLIRAMRSPQEAYNARQSRAIFNISSKMVIIDDDAVDDHEKTAKEINRANAYIIANPDRTNIQGIHVAPVTETSREVMELMMENKQNVFDSTGLHPEFRGMTAGSEKSGVAIDSLIEQTQQVLGGPVDNYREFRRQAGELLFAMIVEDLAQFDNVEVDIPADGMQSARKVVLNRREGDGLRQNNILMMRTRVALAEAPSSVTYRQQKFQSLTEIVKSMPEQLQAVMSDLIVRASELPDNEEILQRIRQVTGFGPEPRDPDEREQLRQETERQKQLEERVQELEMALQEAEMRAKNAKAQLDEAKAAKTSGADTGLTIAQTQGELAQVRQGDAEIDLKDADIDIKDAELDIKDIELDIKREELDIKREELDIKRVEAKAGLIESAENLRNPVDKPESGKGK